MEKGASISKSSFNFEMELRFQNRASISKSNFDFKMEKGASISKWSFDFKMELRFRNGASISKWKKELRFWNGPSISKSSFHFKIELRFQNGKGSFDLKIELRFWNGAFDFEIELRLKDFSRDLLDRKRHLISVHVFLHLSILRFLSWRKASWPEIRREKDREWWKETISKGSEISIKFEQRLQSLIP